ncbi:MAG: alpha/beta fold hydrolase [Spirochaetota bacterium]
MPPAPGEPVSGVSPVDSAAGDPRDDRAAAARLLDRYPQHPLDEQLARASAFRVEVPGGTIRVYRLAPAADGPAALPVLFVPGWGGVIDGFYETLRAIDPAVELVYVETREKRSSRVGRRASFSMRQMAGDVAAAARAAGLEEGRFVLAGSSFGGAVAVQALADAAVADAAVADAAAADVAGGRGAVLRPAVTVLYDPMPRLWIPRWIMSFVAPLLPAWLLAPMRPALKRLVLAGMREPTQRRRTERFIDDAELWKWRAAALRLRRWDVLDVGPRAAGAAHVVNGSTDRFHDGAIYPAIAGALPGGRLLRVPVPESRREHLIGAVLSAYACSHSPADGGASDASAVPPELRRFERAISLGR